VTSFSILLVHNSAVLFCPYMKDNFHPHLDKNEHCVCTTGEDYLLRQASTLGLLSNWMLKFAKLFFTTGFNPWIRKHVTMIINIIIWKRKTCLSYIFQPVIIFLWCPCGIKVKFPFLCLPLISITYEMKPKLLVIVFHSITTGNLITAKILYAIQKTYMLIYILPSSVKISPCKKI